MSPHTETTAVLAHPHIIFERFFTLASPYSDPHPAIAPASDSLREYIAHTTNNPDHTDKSASRGILEFYATFAEEYKGPLRDLIGNHAKYFQGDSGPYIGREISWGTYDKETGDACNLVFQKTDVEENVEAVIMGTKDFQNTRLDIIILQAIRGRSHALDIVLSQENSPDWIDFHLDPFHGPSPPWSKVDFIAICVLLRACAKSLLEVLPSIIERQVKLASWKETLEAFVYSDKPATQDFPFNRDNDFVIKTHAVLALDNLIRGPFDENSRDIFDPAA